ncbi:MAG: UDP-N-acetylmuramate dehydrogenase [FCB group bacterium]|nr:UDP-N-acetylmuramate dehydrogenase [FCB group bacterium]
MDDRYKGFIDKFGGAVKQSEKLSAYTTFRTGGTADLFVDITEVDRLAQVIGAAAEFEIPWFVIGGGSNLLISDDGYSGLIIRNRIQRLGVQDNEIVCGAGEPLDRVVDFATELSLTGFEFAAGIWGYIGGAIYGNAGAFGSDVGSLLHQAELIDSEGQLRTEGHDYFEFGYRHSNLKQTGEIVGTAVFQLEPGDQEEIARRTLEIRQLRESKHPLEANSAGCIFKNIEDPQQPMGKLPAGKLLEESGVKELHVGGAAVFENHANIIINTGGATSKDIRRLADIMKEKVKKKFDIELQEEIISIGNI